MLLPPTLSTLVMRRSACGVSVSMSVAGLLARLVSVVPAGAVTVAVLVKVPVADAMMLAVTVYVIVLPTGMLAVSLMLPDPLAVQPVAPPVAAGGGGALGRLGGDKA